MAGALAGAGIAKLRQWLGSARPPILLAACVGAAIGFTFGLAVKLAIDREPSLTIYSSLPEQAPGGARSKRTSDMEKAIALALNEADGHAGDYRIEYVPLDAADEHGLVTAQTVQANARRAAQDGDTAVYIGDFSSSASIESIPILSEGKVPQISPVSTRVGLTVHDAFTDTDEPDKYYRADYRNFVRIIPNDDVQAAALASLMKREGCRKLATIYDGRDYSQGLAVLMTLFERPKRTFREDIRPNEGSRRYTQLARSAAKRGSDCFLYIGDDNPNTFDIFRVFAGALPGAKLYGTDSVSEASLQDPESGELASFAGDVRLLVPPRDLVLNRGFQQSFANEYPDSKSPDPYAIYAYEAMKLALDAVKQSKNATREEILQQLRSVTRRVSPLGTYSIDPSTGDTRLVDYDVFRFKDGARSLRRAVPLADLVRSTRALRNRK